MQRCSLVGVGAQNGRVGSIVPVHHLVSILVVLLEALEFLLDEDSTSVNEVVSGHVREVLLTAPHLLSVLLHCVFVLGVSGKGQGDK